MKRLCCTLLLFAFAATVRADIVRITVNDTIHPISDEYIGRALDDAAAQKADAVVIELRTPGGLMDSMRGIVEKILRSPVPVIVYVTPSGGYAASAGFFILESSDIAAMAPGTNTGSAHPVILGQKMDEVMATKMENDSAAFMRSIAQKRGRNVAVAESCVRQSKNFTEQEALQNHLIDVVAPNLPSLLRAIDGRTLHRWNGTTMTLHTAGKPIRPFEMSLKQRILSWIMDPNVAFILFSIGMLALWAELNHPGAVLPGVIGLIFILLSVFALNLLPTRYTAFALILAAFVLFALEAKFASHGVLGIGGIICMVLGALFLVDGPIPEMRVRLFTALVVSVPLGVIAIFLMGLAFEARKNKVATGAEAMIGEIGVARTEVGADGKVFVHGELWNATAITPIAAGARIRIRRVDGLHLLVEPADEAPVAAVPQPSVQG
jgi:membrane-bound serine protease (ClpP class)